MDDLIRELKTTGVLRNPLVEQAFRAVDRKYFVPAGSQSEAYENYPLHIGMGQTISQPYTVALMLELLDPKPGQKILDIGAGSGWTTALLAHVVSEGGKNPDGCVIGLELIPELIEFAHANIEKLGTSDVVISGVEIQQAESTLGLPREAPFDRILVSAAARMLPEALMEQLVMGGILVVPIKGALWKVKKLEDQKLETDKIEGFAFVPLIH